MQLVVSLNRIVELLHTTVRLTDGREFGNVNSLAVSEFNWEHEYQVYRLTRLLVNRC